MTRQIIWVTGGGTGIGKALARAFYRQGHWVVISGRRADVLEKAAGEITAEHLAGDVWAIPGDVSQPDYATQAYRSIHERWGDIDVLINNAGENPYHSFDAASPEEFLENFKVNCLSAIRVTKAVLPAMRARRGGTIANVSSILGRWASADSPAYSVSKYALAGFTDSLRQELAGSGVHVMGIYPGFILTPMTMPFVSPRSRRWAFGRSPESMARAIIKGIHKRRRDVIFPWYVPIALNLHHWFPNVMEKLRTIFRR